MNTTVQANTDAQAPPGHLQFNAGNQAWRSGQHALALERYTQATLLDPALTVAHLGRARCLVALGQQMAAREAFAAVLRLDPGNYSAWLEAGHLCRQMGELQQAAGAYQRAVDASPRRFEAHLAMARVLMQMGQADVAETAFTEALALAGQGEGGSPARVAETAHHMGRYRLETGDAQGTVRALAEGLKALRKGPPDIDREAELRIDLGEALWRLGRATEAQAELSAASGASAEATLARLSALSFRLNLWAEAIEVARRNLALHPQSATATWNLAHLLAECWQMDEAEQLLAKAEALAPMPGATAMRASIAGRRGDAAQAMRLYRELAGRPELSGQYASSAAMSSLYCDELSPQEVSQLHRELFEPLGQGARGRDSFQRPPLAGRRLKLGLVTADFHHQHPVNIFMQPVLRELDRSRFELFVYFTGVSYDEQTRLAQRRAEHWVEVTTLNDVQLARRIDGDGIDVLLDLAGHTGQQRMSLFAKRAAPVQATYLGYPGSTGVPNMDWVLGDAVVTPPEADHLCSEQVYRLPGLVFCYAPETDYPLPAFGQAQLSRPLTFGSFNNVPKLTPRTLALWARVLQAVPGSRLLLKAPSFGDASAVRLFSQRLEALGVDLQRVEFRGPTGLDLMMAEYADVDIALDPVPYNGGTTSLQAMWMGVPVLTVEGGHFVSRMGASFMKAAGLQRWVARDDDELVRHAVALAGDRPALLKLKQELRARLEGLPAWNAKAHTEAMQRAFEHMAAAGTVARATY
jgi:protein O-GlcNAc transferase